MDILKDIVYPQSPTNIMLLKYLLFLTLLIVLPYLSVLLGTSFFSVLHFRKGRNSNNKDYLVFANELIDLFTVNKGMTFSLGIVPFLSITFILGQLLLDAGISVTSHLIFGLILLTAALIYLYTYKYSFKLKNIFNLINRNELKDDVVVEDFDGLKKSNSNLLAKSGIIGLLLLVIVVYILIAVLQIVTNTTEWSGETSLIDILFSVNTFLYFLFYLAFSMSITSAAIIYKYFKSGSKSYDSSYLNYVKNFGLKTGLIFTSVQPILFVLTLISIPNAALSFGVFIAAVIILAIMLIVSIQFYLMYKESKTSLGPATVLMLLILASAFIYKDQIAFDTSNELQVMNLHKEYASFADQLKEKAGVMEEVVINGEDIYNAKCIACHRFDTQLVGPSYNSVLPKYEGKKDELVDFILNPRKINPELPSMPNQGLKPKEAEAIADYIVKIYEEGNK